MTTEKIMRSVAAGSPAAGRARGGRGPGEARPAPARVPSPAGARRSRPPDHPGPARPAGRREVGGADVLPPARPDVAGGCAAGPGEGSRRAPVGEAVVRRRRTVAGAVLSVLLCVLVALAAVMLGQAAGADAGPVAPGTRVEVVGDGESLVDVARRAAPPTETIATVARLRQLNGLSSSELRPGTPLLVPAAGP